MFKKSGQRVVFMYIEMSSACRKEPGSSWISGKHMSTAENGLKKHLKLM